MKFTKPATTSGDTYLYWHVPTSGSLFDDGSILSGSVSTSGLFTHITMSNPFTGSAIPENGVYLSTTIRDAFGAVTNVELGDLIYLKILAEDAQLPDDVAVFVTLTSGAVAPSSFGLGVMLSTVSGTNSVTSLKNAGSGWVQTTPNTGSNAGNGAVTTWTCRTTANIASVNAFMVDASGVPVSVANTGIVTFAHTGWTDVFLNTISWGCVWSDSQNGVAGSIAKFSPRLLLIKPTSFPSP